MAGAAGIEPAITVLETVAIPFNYAPKKFASILYRASDTIDKTHIDFSCKIFFKMLHYTWN